MRDKPTDPDEFFQKRLRPRREEIEIVAQLDNPLAERARRVLDVLDQLEEEEE